MSKRFLSDIEKWPRAGSTAWLRLVYKCLNNEFFGGKLPKVDVRWHRCQNRLMAKTMWGLHRGDTKHTPLTIWFDPVLKDQRLQKQVGMSMLHEMVHVKLGCEVECREWHGAFDKEMFRLASAGAFRYFW